ncbi:unnamed protein product, partial [marine sediment metagenome]
DAHTQDSHCSHAGTRRNNVGIIRKMSLVIKINYDYTKS